MSLVRGVLLLIKNVIILDKYIDIACSSNIFMSIQILKMVLVTWMDWREERSRFPTINMFYYTYISYDDYTILIHSFNCPAIKQVFLFFSPHLIIIINLLLLNMITRLIESSWFVILVNHWTVKFLCMFLLFGFFSLYHYFFLDSLTSNWQIVRIRENISLQRCFRSVTNHGDPIRFVWQIVFCGVFVFLYLRTHSRDPSRRATRKKCYGKNERVSARPC